MAGKNRDLLNIDIDDRKICTLYDTFKDKVSKKARKSKSLLRVHSFAFVSINAFLTFLNIITSVGFPWCLFPIGGTAILLTLHYVSWKDRERQETDLEKYPVLTDKALSILKKIFRSRRFTKLNGAFAISVSAFLFMVNIITGPGFLWAAIPAAAFASLSGTQVYFSRYRRKELKEKFLMLAGEKDPAAIRTTKTKSAIGSGVTNIILTESFSLQKLILKQLEQIGMSEDPHIDTIPELVESYISQIKTLLTKNDEINGILELNPYEKLISEKKKISDKLNRSDDDSLKTQYRSTLSELERQMTSSRKIMNQNELLDLKISSAITSIRTLHMDLANLNVEKMSHDKVMKILEEKSSDLSERLEDLQSSYSELEKEML